jgi:hypothetical protein
MDILYFSMQKLHSTKLYIHICYGVCTTREFRTKRGLLLSLEVRKVKSHVDHDLCITELSSAMSSAHPVLLTLMFPIFSPIPTSCKRGGTSYSFRYHQNNNDETQYPNQFDENITKARRSAYSLFGCGSHTLLKNVTAFI